MARPSKLTAALQAQICAAIRNGRQLEEASEEAGISRKTIHRWMVRGEGARSGPHREFYIAVRDALIQTRAALLSVARRASRYDGRTAAYLLARTHDRSMALRRPRSRVEASVEGVLRELAKDPTVGGPVDEDRDADDADTDAPYFPPSVAVAASGTRGR